MNDSLVRDAGIDEMLEQLEGELKRSVERFDPRFYAEMHSMIAYHLGWEGNAGRGKRVRPLLTLLCCQGAGGVWQAALPAASAVELIHNFSLLHDDIQDRSETRRGRPTVWTRWGVPQAINTGDALFVLAHLAWGALRSRGASPQTSLAAREMLENACLRLTEGQYLDMNFETESRVSQERYLEMIEGKTAALLSAATGLGACVAEASPDIVAYYAAFGRHLGLAFQILDDILGIWGDPAVTGKPAGDDLLCRKKTLPVILGLERSADLARWWDAKDGALPPLGEMQAAMEAEGVLDEVNAAAAVHTEQALAALGQAAPAAPSAAQLRGLTLSLLQRDR
jgi:geranylgeranyl diphosphate synthase, type I